MTFRELYVKEMDEITFSEGFEVRTANLMKQRAVRKDEKVLQKRKPMKVLAVVLAVIALLSTAAFAVSYILSAREVADYLGEKEIAEMFEDCDFEPQTASDGTYDVTLLGVTSGEKLNMTEGFECDEKRTYAVVAINKTDGTPLSLMEGMPLQLAPVVSGIAPTSIWNIGFGASGMEREGVLYYLFDYENLEIFAFGTVSIVAFEGFFPTSDILTMDESGKTVYADGYTGFKGIFDLPMDENKADPKAAEELLGTY